MQHRPRTNQELKRMQQGSDGGHDELSLFGMACNLNRRKAYSVSGSYSAPERIDRVIHEYVLAA